MKCRILCLIVCAPLLLSQARAQSSDWQVVKSLPADTQISLQIARHWFPMKCHLEAVTDDELTCAQGWPVSLQAVTYARDRIRTVRVAHNTTLIGLTVGAGAGTVIGLARDPTPGLGRSGDAMVMGGLLGLVGAGIGGIVSPAFPGRVIYRGPRQARPAAHPAKPAPPPADTGASSSMSSPVSRKPSEGPDFHAPMPRLFFPTDAQFSCVSKGDAVLL